MRFVILTQYFWPEVGAPQVRLEAVARQLALNGHEVEIVTTMPSYPTGTVRAEYRRKLVCSELHDDIRIRRVWSYPAQGRGIKRLIGYISFAALSVPLLVRTKRSDFIVIESPPLFLAMPGLLWARLTRRRSILNVADLWPDAALDVGAVGEGLMLSAARRLERWAYRHSSYVSSVTKGIRQAVVERGVTDGRALFLPNGVDTESFSPDHLDLSVRAELGLPDGPLIAFTGTVGLAQGLGNVIDAVGTLGRTRVSLGVVGSGSALQDMRDLATSRGYDNIFFVDPVPRQTIARLLPGCVAGVVSLANLVTNQGARPSKMFPIMASAVPILYCGTGEGAEMVGSVGAGISVPNETSRIREAVQALLDDPNQRTAMGLRGREFVVAEMSWKTLVTDWLESVT